MNLDHNLVQVSKLSEDQKKKIFTKTGTLFPQIQMKTIKGLHQKWNTFFPKFRWRLKKGLHQKWNTFFPQIQVKTKKKKVFRMNRTLFPNSDEDQKKQKRSSTCYCWLECSQQTLTGKASKVELLISDLESSRTSSWTHFEVLRLGLEASSPRKLPCPRLEDSTIFWTVEVLLENARNLAENLPTPFSFSSIGA